MSDDQDRGTMDATDVIAHAQDSLTVRRVFGEPITADGVR
jgi:hypothetical protein